MKDYCNALARNVQRELLQLWRQPRHLVYVILFFITVVVFFPLSIPPEAAFLPEVAPALIWMALLLALLRSAEGLLKQEHQEGVIDQWIIGNHSLITILQSKLLVNWLMMTLPLIMLCPLLLLLYHYDIYRLMLLMSVIFIGSPALLSFCALGASFGLGLQQRGIMMTLIVFPLVIPILILGSGFPAAVMAGQPPLALLALLLACSIVSVAFLPFAMAAIIKIDACK